MNASTLARGTLARDPEVAFTARLRRAILALLERLAAASPDPPPEFFRQPFP